MLKNRDYPTAQRGNNLLYYINAIIIYITRWKYIFPLQELKRKGVDKIISKQVKLGKLYIGESAGAIIASPDAEYMRSVNFDPIEKAPKLKDCTSLDLVDFYTIPIMEISIQEKR